MNLYDKALREQTLFALYENPPVSDTEAALREGLSKVFDKMYKTKGDWTRAKMVEISKAISAELKVPLDGLLPKVDKDIAAQLNAVSLFGVNRKAVANITNPTNMVQGYEMKDLFKVTKDNHIRQIQVTFAAAVARGASVDETVRLLRDKNDTLTKTQLKSAVITAQNEARAKVRHEEYQQMEDAGVIIGYVYDATLDSRTTEYCRNHDGKVYKKPIKEIANLINTHFRCRSVFRPYDEGVVTRASVFGPVENQSYSTWFDNQSSEFQSMALGPTKYKQYMEGTYKIGGLVDVMNSGQVLSLDQIQSQVEILNGEPYGGTDDRKDLTASNMDAKLNQVIDGWSNRDFRPIRRSYTPDATDRDKVLGDQFNKLFTDFKENYEGELFRGLVVSKEANIGDSLKVGMDFVDPSPSSFSKFKGAAEKFTARADYIKKFSQSVFIRVKKTKGYDLKNFVDPRFLSEGEVVIAPGKKFKIISVEQKGDEFYVELE